MKGTIKMSQLVETARQQLRGAVLSAIEGAIAAGELPEAPIPDFALEVPGDRAHGDWACNAAMAGASAPHTAAPSPAPELTPMMLGAARGLPSTPWITAPDTARADPASRQAQVRGRRA